MSVFEDVELNWKGRVYTVPANNVLRMIAKMEEVITLNELIDSARKGAVPLSRISMAFGTALRHAGADVSDDELYANIFSEPDAATHAVQLLLGMMAPPKDLMLGTADQGSEQGKQ